MEHDMDRRLWCSLAPNRRGEEGDDTQGKTLDVPADLLRSDPRLQSWSLGSVGVCDPTNGGKTTLVPLKTKHLIEVSEYIFKQNNVFTALNMHVMMSVVFSWLENLVTFWEIWEEETHPYYKGLLA